MLLLLLLLLQYARARSRVAKSLGLDAPVVAPRERAARQRKVVRYDYEDYDRHMRVRTAGVMSWTVESRGRWWLVGSVGCVGAVARAVGVACRDLLRQGGRVVMQRSAQRQQRGMRCHLQPSCGL